MPLQYSGVVACERCGRAVRVLWPTINAPWNAVVPDGEGSLLGWRLGYSYVKPDDGAEAQAFCPDHASNAPSGFFVYA